MTEDDTRTMGRDIASMWSKHGRISNPKPQTSIFRRRITASRVLLLSDRRLCQSRRSVFLIVASSTICLEELDIALGRALGDQRCANQVA